MAFVSDDDEARRLLHRLGLPATGPPLAPARPPQWQAELDLELPEDLGIDPTYPDDASRQRAGRAPTASPSTWSRSTVGRPRCWARP